MAVAGMTSSKCAAMRRANSAKMRLNTSCNVTSDGYGEGREEIAIFCSTQPRVLYGGARPRGREHLDFRRGQRLEQDPAARNATQRTREREVKKNNEARVHGIRIGGTHDRAGEGPRYFSAGQGGPSKASQPYLCRAVTLRSISAK